MWSVSDWDDDVDGRASSSSPFLPPSSQPPHPTTLPQPPLGSPYLYDTSLSITATSSTSISQRSSHWCPPTSTTMSLVCLIYHHCSKNSQSPYGNQLPPDNAPTSFNAVHCYRTLLNVIKLGSTRIWINPYHPCHHPNQ